MKRIILLVLLITSITFGQYTNWEDKTAEQLSGITSGVTNIASKDYWTSNAYAQLKVAFDLLGDLAIEATDTTELKAMPADTSLYVVFLNQDADSLNGWYYKIDSAFAEAGDYDYFDCAETGKQWKRYIGIPFPTSNLSADSIIVSADSGLGGGGSVDLGGTVNLQAHVDNKTIEIYQDTMRVYGYKYHFPGWSNMVPWNLNDFRTAQDSVTICYDVEASTYWPYMQIEKSSSATDSQYVFPHFAFVAPRNVSEITDTLFIVRYKCTSADTLNVGMKLMVYEGTTARYTATDITASTSWSTLVVRKSYGTMTSIVSGDEFYLIPYCKVDGDSLWIGRIEERWY